MSLSSLICVGDKILGTAIGRKKGDEVEEEKVEEELEAEATDAVADEK